MLQHRVCSGAPRQVDSRLLQLVHFSQDKVHSSQRHMLNSHRAKPWHSLAGSNSSALLKTGDEAPTANTLGRSHPTPLSPQVQSKRTMTSLGGVSNRFSYVHWALAVSYLCSISYFVPSYLHTFLHTMKLCFRTASISRPLSAIINSSWSRH